MKQTTKDILHGLFFWSMLCGTISILVIVGIVTTAAIMAG